MKKLFALVLTIVMTTTLIAAYADDLGVQIIGGDQTSSEPVSLDDIQLESSVEIPGYAEITPTAWIIQNCFIQRKSGINFDIGGSWKGSQTNADYDGKYHKLDIECSQCGSNDYPFFTSDWVIHSDSKSQADYAFLYMTVLNTTNKARDFTADVTVKVVFDDNVEYAGWIRQRNLDLSWSTISSSDNFEIGPYYRGFYIFGCTLPNAVLSSKSPLRMVITMDGNEITYNARK